MGDMASLWGYEEYHDMEQLGQKLLLTSLELEKLKAEANEEVRKNKELIYLLKFAIKERDEAKNQLQNLLNKTLPLAITTENLPTIPPFQADTPLVKPVKGNSSITESNSFSETYNYHSHGSSPVNSFLDAVPSPEFTNINLVVNTPLVQESNTIISNNRVSSEVVQKFDQVSLIIDNLVKGRSLPQQGKFLQAVLDAGPLLQTLFVAGPLPRWRNPPQLQPFQIPPVSIKSCDAEIFTQKPASNSAQLAFRSLNSHPYAQMSCGSSQVLSTPMLNFTNVASGSCLSNNSSLISSVIDANTCVTLAKRQRFC